MCLALSEVLAVTWVMQSLLRCHPREDYQSCVGGVITEVKALQLWMREVKGCNMTSLNAGSCKSMKYAHSKIWNFNRDEKPDKKYVNWPSNSTRERIYRLDWVWFTGKRFKLQVFILFHHLDLDDVSRSLEMLLLKWTYFSGSMLLFMWLTFVRRGI